jgi:hypothetical protein
MPLISSHRTVSSIFGEFVSLLHPEGFDQALDPKSGKQKLGPDRE